MRGPLFFPVAVLAHAIQLPSASSMAERREQVLNERVQRMKVGGESRLVYPSEITNDDGGRRGIPGGASFVFAIELLSLGGGAK
jgi:hypothetical protein